MHPKLTQCALKNQEALFLYNFNSDERYELDLEAFKLLRHCTGKNSFEDILRITEANRNDSKDLIDYLTGERCIEDRWDKNAVETYPNKPSILPSLRYLQLHITERCNLNCAHCYLGEKEKKDLDPGLIKKAVEEFSTNGLKVLITGGEAMMHKQFWDVLGVLKCYPVRLELLSNGTMISQTVAKRLSKYIHRIQISLDGMKKGHEQLRGKNSFEKTIEGIKNSSEALDVTIATMVHSGNLSEFDELKTLVQSIGAKEWDLDIPSLAGNASPDLIPKPVEAAEIFKKYGFGTGVHEGDQGYSCGSHICTINVVGGVSKCGFFEESVGNIKDENLVTLWKRVVDRYTPKVDLLKCKTCAVVEECRGGCRYRASVSGDFFGKDEFMCAVYNGENDG